MITLVTLVTGQTLHLHYSLVISYYSGLPLTGPDGWLNQVSGHVLGIFSLVNSSLVIRIFLVVFRIDSRSILHFPPNVVLGLKTIHSTQTSVHLEISVSLPQIASEIEGSILLDFLGTTPKLGRKKIHPYKIGDQGLLALCVPKGVVGGRKLRLRACGCPQKGKPLRSKLKISRYTFNSQSKCWHDCGHR